MKMQMMGTALSIMIAGTASAGVAAYSFSFEGVSNNNAANTAAGEAQFELVVSQSADNAIFTFNNIGPIASVMSELYWDDNANIVDSMNVIDDSHPGVSYEPLGSSVNPGNLPAGNTIGFNAEYAIEPNNPQPHNGIGVNETLSVTFDLNGPFADVIAAIQSGDLRVGVHAQSFPNGGSESFVTGGGDDPPTGIPTPSAAALGLILLAGVGARRRQS